MLLDQEQIPQVPGELFDKLACFGAGRNCSGNGGQRRGRVAGDEGFDEVVDGHPFGGDTPGSNHLVECLQRVASRAAATAHDIVDNLVGDIDLGS